MKLAAAADKLRSKLGAELTPSIRPTQFLVLDRVDRIQRIRRSR